MKQDAIIIGGSYAGMAAALQLVRARRHVLILDAGLRRNRFASHSHGFLGQDGVDPAAIWQVARDQLLRYPTLTWQEGQVQSASGGKDDFRVTLQDGTTYEGRRLLFATGVRDILPDIPGLADLWGKSLFHCPYCHGYELDRGLIGVIATGPMSLHQAQLLPEWGPTTFLVNNALTLEDEARADLVARGVIIEETPIRHVEAQADITLTDGRNLRFAGLFTAPRSVPASAVAETLGCTLQGTPFGIQIETDSAKETSVPGAFACGDVARMPHSVSLAVGDGAWAGAQIHRSLVF